MEKTRREHMIWCKARAREYAEQGDFMGCTMSMLSDIGKHEETRSLEGPMSMSIISMRRDKASLIAWVDGWAE